MSKPDLPIEHIVQGHGVDLSVLEIGHPEDPTVIMLHGLRDTAWALLPVAEQLAYGEKQQPNYRVLITELRGHGASGGSDGYAMADFVLDLHAITQSLTEGACALFGHSLGGHVVTKFAALFPELVKAMIVVEGLGPPKRPHEGNEALEVKIYREMLLSRVARTEKTSSKPIQDIADVADRLLRNNPRLDPQMAERFAPHLVTNTEDGLQWAFDSRASGVFLGANTLDNERFWRQVQAPTCIVSGTLSYQYWGREMPAEGFSGHFAEGEMEARAANFDHHEHHWFEHSGHMVHYDEPDRLAQLSRIFLEQYHV